MSPLSSGINNVSRLNKVWMSATGGISGIFGKVTWRIQAEARV